MGTHLSKDDMIFLTEQVAESPVQYEGDDGNQISHMIGAHYVAEGGLADGRIKDIFIEKFGVDSWNDTIILHSAINMILKNKDKIRGVK